MTAFRRTALLLAPVGILAEAPSLGNVRYFLIYGLFALPLQVVMVIGILGGELYFFHQIGRRA
jgi:hypothetical protein